MSKLSHRSSVYRAAMPVSGHRIRLAAGTARSTSTAELREKTVEVGRLRAHPSATQKRLDELEALVREMAARQ